MFCLVSPFCSCVVCSFRCVPRVVSKAGVRRGEMAGLVGSRASRFQLPRLQSWSLSLCPAGPIRPPSMAEEAQRGSPAPAAGEMCGPRTPSCSGPIPDLPPPGRMHWPGHTQLLGGRLLNREVKWTTAPTSPHSPGEVLIAPTQPPARTRPVSDSGLGRAGGRFRGCARSSGCGGPHCTLPGPGGGHSTAAQTRPVTHSGTECSVGYNAASVSSPAQLSLFPTD